MLAQSDYVVDLDKETEESWNSLIREFTDSSVYQTFAYGAVRWGANNLSHIVLRKAGEVVAAAQIRIVSLPLVRSGIAYLRWGPLLYHRSGGKCPLDLVLRTLRQEYVSKRGFSLLIIPPCFQDDHEAAEWNDAFQLLNFTPVDKPRAYRTITVPLQRPVEEMRKALDKKWRNQLNSSERNKLSISLDVNLDGYDQFLRLYDGMLARKQFSSTVDVLQFRRIQEQLPASLRLQCYVAQKEGEGVAAVVCARVGKIGIYLLGASSERGRELKATYALHWQVMQNLRNQQCTFYDLGGIDPIMNPGGYHFKSGFGGNDRQHISAHVCAGRPLSRLATRLLQLYR